MIQNKDEEWSYEIRVFLSSNHKKERMPYITGRAVDYKKYILDSFHFHWGNNDFNGSEHSINGVFRSAEVHLVHYNELYGNISNAINKTDGLVVITIFIETKVITDFGFIEVNDINNQVITPITKELYRIKKFDSYVNLNLPISLKDLLPKNKNLFYRYSGSLTTPPCSQSVVFIIFVDPLYISSSQVIIYKQLVDNRL
ncbi:putative carbonic anhydrase 5 [Oppia nitens]|uniref:putative carbonic anhydrase 5 n=1 Tax=Oppia nitens TaxID=1686743 RepID=UPI0023DC4E80|nr:putative carbonic anhydrase 5 [Oppia nitens]